MKNLTNILSYLWLLLLMAVTACSDLEEEVGPMQSEEEVELTIQLHVPDMQASTRTAPTENITAITAYAFDGNSQLIKEVKAILSDDKQATSGNLRIKVPKRTGDIHFVAKNNDANPDVTINLEDNVSTLLSQTTDDLHYWGKATYNGGNNLSVTLIRNMAKVKLITGSDDDCIAGILNYNKTGRLVPGNFTKGTLNADDNVDNEPDSEADLNKDHYLFEHANDKGNSPLYAICKIGGMYYKVAFAYTNNGEVVYYDIFRNQEYIIKIEGQLDEMYAENYYTDAVNSQCPINDLVITTAPITFTPNPAEVQNESGQTFTVDVTIPEGITELNVPTHDAFDITPPNSLTPQNGKYTVTQGTYEFTFTVKGGVEAGNKTISFSGRGKYKSATGSATVNLYEMVQITAELTPQITSLNYSANSVSDLIVNVTIPAGVTTLNFSSDYFDVEFINSTSLTDNGNGSYTVTGGDTISADARLRLKNKTATQNAGFTFSGTGEGVMVTPATINNITLQASGDENVRWQGDVELSYENKNNASKIVLPYSWFSSVLAGSKLRVEYEILSTGGPIIQFSEVKDEWDNPGFHFPELETTTNNGKIGCNLSDTKTDTNNWIYGTNESTFTGSASFDLTLSQDVLNDLAANLREYLFGGEDIVIAIQGENVRLKKISVIPKAPLSKIELDFYSAENRDNNVYDDLQLGTTRFYLKATISYEDSEKYNNQTVQLQGEFNSPNSWANANGAIHWDFSKNGVDKYSDDNDDIRYYGDNHNGTGLEFTIQDGKTEYLIDWVFVTGGHYSGGDIAFTYTISNYAISDVDGTFNNFAGDTSATIAFTNEPVIDCNFNNNTKPDWYDSEGGTTKFENGILSFTTTSTGSHESHDYDNQIRFTGLSIVNEATYKLTFKIRSSVSDSEGLDIGFDDPSDNYIWCGLFSDNSLKLNASGNFTEVTLTTTATKTINNARLFINLGHLGASCTIEIDDLKLVRTN